MLPLTLQRPQTVQDLKKIVYLNANCWKLQGYRIFISNLDSLALYAEQV